MVTRTDPNASPLAAEVAHIVARYPTKQAAVMATLWLFQERHGRLDMPLLREAAGLLNLSPAYVLGIYTFYTLYDRPEDGRYVLHVCNTLPCALKGAGDLVNHLRERLGVDIGATTEDGCFTLKKAECLAACDGAPAIQINRRYLVDVTPEIIDEVIDALLAGEDLDTVLERTEGATPSPVAPDVHGLVGEARERAAALPPLPEPGSARIEPPSPGVGEPVAESAEPGEPAAEAEEPVEPAVEVEQPEEPDAEEEQPEEPVAEVEEPEEPEAPATEAEEPEAPAAEEEQPEEPAAEVEQPREPAVEVEEPEEPEAPAAEAEEPVEPAAEAEEPEDPEEPEEQDAEPGEPSGDESGGEEADPDEDTGETPDASGSADASPKKKKKKKRKKNRGSGGSRA